jgi:hypothetical protein
MLEVTTKKRWLLPLKLRATTLALRGQFALFGSEVP